MLQFCLFLAAIHTANCAISASARPRVIGPDGFEAYAEAVNAPRIEIRQPSNAQLIVGDAADEAITFEYEVSNFQLGDRGEVEIYFLVNTVQSGLHTFETIPFVQPYERSKDSHKIWTVTDLPYGLHYILVRLVSLPARENIAEDARYFELRYINEFDTREPQTPPAVLEAAYSVATEMWYEAKLDSADVLGKYELLHHNMLAPKSKMKKRFVVIDAMMGGLGNRLGSIVSGMLLALVTDRAFLVASDLPKYFEQKSEVAWNYESMEQVRQVIRAAGGDEDELKYDDMWDLTELLTCADIKSTLGDRTTIVIQTPHYFAPFLFANPYYRQFLYETMGDDAAGILHRYLFELVPRLKQKVDQFRSNLRGRELIALQIRQDHSCDNMTLTNDRGEHVRTKAFMTYEHEQLYFTCAASIARGIRGYPASVAFFVASDLPVEMVELAGIHFGKENLVFSPISTNPEKERDEMSSKQGVEFGGAVLDMWLLGEADYLIATPASSFGWMGAARSSLHTYLVTKWGKCVQAVAKQPFCHGLRLLEHTSCFRKEMYVPENDMICQDCVSLECACGSLTCGSHSEKKANLFPRGACRLPG